MSRLTARLLRQNDALRQSIKSEFQAMSAAPTLPSYTTSMGAYRHDLLAAVDANDAALEFLLGRVADESGVGHLVKREVLSLLPESLGGARDDVYDGLGSLWRHLAKDWSRDGSRLQAPLRERVTQHVAAECVRRRASLGEDASPLRVLIPGCGQARLAWSLASAPELRDGVRTTAYERSEATLAFARCMLRASRTEELTVHPWLDAFSNNLEPNGRLGAVTVPDVAPAAAPTVDVVGSPLDDGRLELVQGDFLGAEGAVERRGGAPHVLITSFFLDCLDDVAAGVQAVSDGLAPGGLWVYAGPLHFHRASATERSKLGPPSTRRSDALACRARLISPPLARVRSTSPQRDLVATCRARRPRCVTCSRSPLTSDWRWRPSLNWCMRRTWLGQTPSLRRRTGASPSLPRGSAPTHGEPSAASRRRCASSLRVTGLKH